MESDKKLKLTFGAFAKELEVENIRNIHNCIDDLISDLESYVQEKFGIKEEDFTYHLYLE